MVDRTVDSSAEMMALWKVDRMVYWKVYQMVYWMVALKEL